MLQKLVVKNYAIIDKLVLEPTTGLNTLTGETGAGKSIILGALSLILGERADTAVLINKDEKCIVEGYFDVSANKVFKAALKEDDLDDETLCIIRREISSAGKSRAFVNDTPVNLTTLNKLTSLLVDLHQQFDHLALKDDHFQMDVLDALAKNSDLRLKYAELFDRYRKVCKKLTESKEEQARWQKEADYKQYLFDELQQAAFKEDEVEQAEIQLKQLNHAERIISVLQAGRLSLEEGEQPIVNELKRIIQQLQTITDVMPEASSLHERMSSVWAELKDIAAELDNLESKVSLDPALMQTLLEKVDIGYKLFKKHAVTSTNDLLAVQSDLEEGLKASLDLNDTIERLEKEQHSVYEELLNVAERLSAARQKVAPQIAKKVTELLALVGMPNAQFKITLSREREPSVFGIDDVQFLLDANKSGQFQYIHKAASGGEMSRIMLCIKSLTAKAMHMPTLIFDEVDTGVSGEAARQVGILLRDLAQYHQVICITHQPQVAAKGNNHFYVYKDAAADKRITTKIKTLQAEERVLAIARMIGGEKPSEAALENARELVAL
ncbi:MAG TPA: DNA repair protein RecN [Flavipsychrobacter sp.]|nr:DNA repair protein RecN [Flavipsychrobacter sp.]